MLILIEYLSLSLNGIWFKNVKDFKVKAQGAVGMKILEYFQKMTECEASDLFLSTNAIPSLKVQGQLIPLEGSPLAVGQVKTMAYEILNADQQAKFESTNEINIAFSQNSLGRFRVNVFKQRNEVAMVVRALKTEIPSPESIGLPEVLKECIMQKSGLIIVTGATGTGKSTTLASLIKYRSENSAAHIITIEDPIEFLHRHTKNSIINQREIGVDTQNYESSLENALRQSPDLILIGECRTQEAMEYALRFSETGHLCLTTLHAQNAPQAIERIINFFPHERHKQLLLDLSIHLSVVISQRLIPTQIGKRTAAFEVLRVTPLVADLIKQGRTDEIKEVMTKSEVVGMQTFDKALLNLYQLGQITLEETLRNADSANNLRIQISLAAGKFQDHDNLSIMPDM